MQAQSSPPESSFITQDLVKNSLKKLDIGGFMVTMYRLVSDSNFILKIKQEFLENKLYEKIQKEVDEIEKTNSLLMSFEEMHELLSIVVD